MPNPDLQITTNAFVEFGGTIFGKNVLAWNLRNRGIQVRTNVNKPQAMTKLSTNGTPQPYAAADNIAGNGAKFTDRILTAFQSKWDSDFDPEEFRNTYLASTNMTDPFYAAAINQMCKEYLDYIIRSTLYNGVRNGAGTAPADICDGWGTIIAAEIVANTITPVATGAITTANAVEKVELLTEDASFPIWMREKGFVINCSYNIIDKYKTRYRALNAFGFKPNETGDYQLDNKLGVLRPQAFMGVSQRLVATIDNNLVFGTDLEQISIAASMRRNIIETRPMMPVGCQIQDLDAIVVNDQA